MFLLSILFYSSLYLFVGGYVVVQEKLPNYVVPDLTDFKVLKLAYIYSF